MIFIIKNRTTKQKVQAKIPVYFRGKEGFFLDSRKILRPCDAYKSYVDKRDYY